MTAVGGMLLLGHGVSDGLIPNSPAHWLGAFATALSFINIAGGFLVSGKMLDLFRRPTDPKDFFEFYAIPVGLVLAGLGGAGLAGLGNLGVMSGAVAIASAICCIAGIAGLADQKTARTVSTTSVPVLFWCLATNRLFSQLVHYQWTRLFLRFLG